MRAFATTLLFALCVAGATQAQDLSERRTERVTYSDLNIENTAGAKTLYRRIEAASRRVCATDDSGRMPLNERSAYDACRTQAMESALRSINNPYLTAYAHREAMPIAVAQH